ncbi:MAG: hypothetical protein HY556_08405 [Euryarchaeota archaeon]|nr:hypothetical protein [Euryarchaeota archaeon]
MKPRIDPNNYNACPDYNDWLDESYSDAGPELNIQGFQPRASHVLFTMSQDTYQAAFADFLQERDEQLKETISYEFPSPIAYYFYRFENGYENELQRLHLLRDTWEATVDILHALVISECRFRKLGLHEPLAFSDLLTESVAQRLLNIERIVSHAQAEGVALDVVKIFSPTMLGTMRALNQSRNAFSHSAAQSELQAQTWIGECYSDVIEVLGALKGLATVEILRYLSQPNALTLRCEVFKGHGSTRTIRDVPMTADQARESQHYFQQGQMLVLTTGPVLSLRPMVHYCQDEAGQSTKLCLFRKTRGDPPDRRIEYEVVGDAVRRDEARATFQLELDELRSIFGLEPE